MFFLGVTKLRKISSISCAIAVVVLATAGAQAETATAPLKLLDPAQKAPNLAGAQAIERKLGRLPAEALQDKHAETPLKGTPAIHAGSPGPAAGAADTGTAGAGGIIGQRNYGNGNLSSIYHYTDLLIDPKIRGQYPYRATGWFVFTYPSGGTFRCTATLIAKSILVTAGHCVHEGGNSGAGYITSGTYYPAYANGASSTYGQATAAAVITTAGWYSGGGLDQGYDVGLVVLNKRTGTTSEIGTKTGVLSFCYLNCLQTYWYLTQHGYPGNYYSGTVLTQGQHLEASDTRDFVLGSGMQGGSSGGPHIANLGSISDGSSDKGQWTPRNVVFAVTSWGYVNESFKIQGAPSLSGPNNSNNFRGLYNTMCNFSRSRHGTASCGLLP